MATEAVSKEMYKALIDLDSHLHNVLSLSKTKRKSISLKELQSSIELCLLEEIEDTTTIIREMREKSYD